MTRYKDLVGNMERTERKVARETHVTRAKQFIDTHRPRNTDGEPISALDAVAATAVGGIVAARFVSLSRAREAGKKPNGIVDAFVIPTAILVSANILEHGLADTTRQAVEILTNNPDY